MPERNIAVRVTTREIQNAIVYEPTNGNPVRFTRELMPIPRVKIVGMLRIDPAIRKGEEKDYMNLILDDIYGSVNVFVFDTKLLENIAENMKKGTIVQVVGKVRTGNDRNIIIAEGVNVVPPETYVYHLYRVAKQLKRHYEYLRIMKRIDDIQKKANLLKAQGGSANVIKAGRLLTEASALKSTLPQQYITIMDIIEQYIIDTYYADIGLLDDEIEEEELFEERPNKMTSKQKRENTTENQIQKKKTKYEIDEGNEDIIDDTEEEIEDISENTGEYDEFEIIDDSEENDEEIQDIPDEEFEDIKEFDEIDEI